MRRELFALVVVFMGAAVFAERQPYERYQTIVDRQMFGQPPDGFDPSVPPSEVARTKGDARSEVELSKEQEKLKSAIHFSVINVTPEGDTAVGFTDNSTPKEPHHYYLKVGEERDGWTVKEANLAEKSMTIVKDEIEVSLTLGGDSSKGLGTTLRAGGMRNASNGSMRAKGLGSLLSSAPRVASQDEVALGNTLRDRKRVRLERERKQRELSEAEKAAREKAREEARLEQERKEAEEKAYRKEKEEETKRDLAEMKAKLEQMREMQEAKENASKTMEADGGEAPVEDAGGEE